MREPKLCKEKKNGSVYFYIRFWLADQKRYKKISLGTSDRKKAESMFRRIEQDYYRGLYVPENGGYPSEPCTIAEGVDRYLEVKKRSVKPRSYETIEEVILKFKKQFGDVPIAALPLSDIETFCYADSVRRLGKKTVTKPVKDRTKAKRLGEIKKFYRWCIDHEIISGHKVVKLKGPSPTQSPPRFLSRSEYDRLLDVCRNTYLYPVVVLGVSTGLRRGSLCRLQWSDVDLEGGFIHVPTSKAKRGGYSVPIFPAARRVLEMLLRERNVKGTDYVILSPSGLPLGPSRSRTERLSRHMTEKMREAQLPEEITLHSLRHTYASWLVQSGLDIYQVSKWMGHKDVQQTQIYARLRPLEANKQAERVFGDQIFFGNYSPLFGMCDTKNAVSGK